MSARWPWAITAYLLAACATGGPGDFSGNDLGGGGMGVDSGNGGSSDASKAGDSGGGGGTRDAFASETGGSTGDAASFPDGSYDDGGGGDATDGESPQDGGGPIDGGVAMDAPMSMDATQDAVVLSYCPNDAVHDAEAVLELAKKNHTVCLLPTDCLVGQCCFQALLVCVQQ